ncbi:hypothetical protein DFH29DRAFT_768326, partial [Suillus ampliporus]
AISSDIPYQGFSHEALSQVFFGGSTIQNPIAIAAFISAVAPNIKSIEAWDAEFHGDDDYLENSPPWNLVQNLIKTLPIIREQ